MKRPLFLSDSFAGHEPTPDSSREESQPADAGGLFPSRNGAGVVWLMGSRLSFSRMHWDHEQRAWNADFQIGAFGSPSARPNWSPALRFLGRIARSICVGAAALMCLIMCNVCAGESNHLSDTDKQSGWRLLFDGRTAKGWRGYKQTAMPAGGWKVEGGILKKVGGERGGDIITEEKFDNFELSWEWRISPAGNNGLKYLVTEDRPSAPGHEYQMIDDTKNPDAKVGPHRATGSFYDVLPPADDKPLKPVGEWNLSRVVIQGNHVEHWLNGKKVLEYELGSDALKAAIARSKFRNSPGFGEKIRGHIMLTDHGDECSFRNIRIRELLKVRFE